MDDAYKINQKTNRYRLHLVVSDWPRGDGQKFLLAKFCVKSKNSALRKHLKSPTKK